MAPSSTEEPWRQLWLITSKQTKMLAALIFFKIEWKWKNRIYTTPGSYCFKFRKHKKLQTQNVLSKQRQTIMKEPRGLDGKESACNVRDLGSIPRLRTSLGAGNGKPLQYSCLENSMNREAYGPRCCKESDVTEWLIFSLVLPGV